MVLFFLFFFFAMAFVVGSISALRSVRESKNRRGFRGRAVRVPGVVVGVSWQSATPSSDYQLAMPILQFHTREGRPMRAVDPIGSIRPHLRPGTPVAVLYDPVSPDRACLEGSVGTFETQHAMAAWLGFGFTAVGLLGLLAFAARFMMAG